MNIIRSRTLIFITGAFLHNSCWDEWKLFFESKGYTCIAPLSPYKDAPALVLRKRHPDAVLASLRLSQMVDYYANIITKLPDRPIIIGHSLGGLITQLLIQRDLVSAGIAIHSIPPQGIITLKFSFLKSIWRPMVFFTSINKTFLMSFSQWKNVVANGMSLEEQKEFYDKYAVPESTRLLRDTLTGIAKVDFKKPHVPLLFLSGNTDNFIPPSLNYTNFKEYRNSNSVTDYEELVGRNHFALGQPTWKEDADYILKWIDKIGKL